MKSTSLILNLNEVGMQDLEIVGGKNASLGEMIQNLSKLGIAIPGGFIITVKAYRDFISYNKLDQIIPELIAEMKEDDIESLGLTGKKIRTLIENGSFPAELSQQIAHAYQALSDHHGQFNVDVAVRSSATAEDLPDASFAGQQETYLNICGQASLLVAIRNCFASLFTDRALSYRENLNFDHFQIGLSVCIQKMVRSDLAASGVAFSLDTESGFREAIIINASYGLGELIVQGAVSPDEFIVFKPALKKGFHALIEKKLGNKNRKMVYGKTKEERVKTITVEAAAQEIFCISDEMALQLSKWILLIEDHYSAKKGAWCPMDIEWAIDGISGELFIVQARPETVHSRKKTGMITEYSISDKNRKEKVILKGIAVGDKIAGGKVHILKDLKAGEIHLADFRKGDILVADMTDPDWEPIMKHSAAIITNKGGRTCHAAIVAREMGVPAIVGCGNATAILQNGQLITASCAEGDAGIVYGGLIPFEKQEFDLSELPETITPLMLNVASPDTAFHYSHFPNKGVGLAREEFIINNYINVHPMALLRHRQLNDPELSSKIHSMIRGFKSEEAFFIDKLSYGIARIGAAFYPNKVIVRFSDFKSNEYMNLLGGKYFEPQEENPMIGWRGASRYYSAEYKEAFGLECKAIKKVREEMGLDNIIVMIPFCRTPKELERVYEVMEEYGLKRGENGLEVYLMAELPSNIILAEQFAAHIDGFSIGSNDLTQLVLGLDRDSSLVAHLYDERNEAVKSMISSLIRTAKKMGVKVGICGQGPSDFPDFAKFLVEEGIDTISVTPDSFFKTVQAIYEIETKLSIERELPQIKDRWLSVV
ncbi:phosphoenolpyruvate synthase [Daejeonella sp.]|uniref:phosphoenolpyruvate synthase n=1 Tax=Daejeonella sp. TaxID=2805397 RepID=UPI002731B11E|nr:phosphoenolpyruvate synthase [Daejeonella sp.]MDP2414146.1 phosphoenolpyruvate synthase [Daejeonella sp.]